MCLTHLQCLLHPSGLSLEKHAKLSRLFVKCIRELHYMYILTLWCDNKWIDFSAPQVIHRQDQTRFFPAANHVILAWKRKRPSLSGWPYLWFVYRSDWNQSRPGISMNCAAEMTLAVNLLIFRIQLKKIACDEVWPEERLPVDIMQKIRNRHAVILCSHTFSFSRFSSNALNIVF